MRVIDYPALAAFLREQSAATIAVPVDEAGELHAASLLYWNSDEPLAFYFVTSRDSEKYKLLKSTNEIPCAVVIGTEKDISFTLQMRGALAEVDPAEHVAQVQAYYNKRGNKHDDLSDPKTCLLRFLPTWARFTDYSKGYERQFLDIS